MASSSISVGNLDDDLSISSSLHNLTEDDSDELSAGTSLPKGVRLVANGSTQLLGVHVDETFSPVVKSATIPTVHSLTISRHWFVCQLDVKNAFLYGDLSETIYMHQREYAYEILKRAHMVGFISSTLVDTESNWEQMVFVPGPTSYRSLAEPHFSALKRILRYVSGTLDHGLRLYLSSTSSLVVY
ncbi:ribonuclease H-like domain-containing protein [Tanacetum coccineum]